MFDSLKEWCRFPVYIHRNTGYTIAGDESFATQEANNGYQVDEVVKIVDKTGKEYVSTSQVYFPQCVDIETNDKISFSATETPREIKKIGGFYDGNTGLLDIKVVYL